jgi:hypothetical protein
MASELSDAENLENVSDLSLEPDSRSRRAHRSPLLSIMVGKVSESGGPWNHDQLKWDRK